MSWETFPNINLLCDQEKVDVLIVLSVCSLIMQVNQGQPTNMYAAIRTCFILKNYYLNFWRFHKVWFISYQILLTGITFKVILIK